MGIFTFDGPTDVTATFACCWSCVEHVNKHRLMLMLQPKRPVVDGGCCRCEEIPVESMYDCSNRILRG